MWQRGMCKKVRFRRRGISRLILILEGLAFALYTGIYMK